MHNLTRRGVLVLRGRRQPVSRSQLAAAPDVDDTFPSTPPELAREIVSVSHFDVDRVRELLTEDRSLCLASRDWGFGDWESALGAASHMGRRDIAQVLIDHGARPNLFTLAMLDEVDAVRAVCQTSPGIQRICGPHGITLLRHAEFGKDERVVECLQKLGGAGEREFRLDLPEDAIDTYLGKYEVEGDNRRQLLMGRSRRGGFGIDRGETLVRLLRTGDHVFSPSGSPHVTVRFGVVDDRAVGLTVHRGKPVLSATRVGD